MRRAHLSIILGGLSLLFSCAEEFPSEYVEVEVERVSCAYTYHDAYRNSINNASYCPSLGKVNLLVLPVWFADSEDFIELYQMDDIREDIDKAFFGDEFDTGWESVSTYFKKDSCGKLEISGITAPWFECERPSAYYEEDDGTKTIALIEEVTDWYKLSNPDVDFDEFDSDDDGYLDGVVLIYAAPDYKSKRTRESNRQNLWAYCYWTQDEQQRSLEDPGANAFLWASYDFLYDPMVSYERTAKTRYSGGHNANGLLIDAHVYIHETGHLFGLEDYYDYGSTTNKPTAGFSMQDANIAGHDPFSKMALGWASPFVPKQTSTFSVKPMEGTNEMVVLSSDYSGSPFDEYIVLELFTPKGLNERDCTYRYGNYPTGPKEAGVRIWHVDARLLAIQGEETFLTREITEGLYYQHATSNTSSGYRAFSYAGKAEYDLNHLIRKDASKGYYDSNVLSAEDLFVTDDVFDVQRYANQFVNKTLMNDGSSFPWKVKFRSVDENRMVITCLKTA